jgi:hypothetical protein
VGLIVGLIVRLIVGSATLETYCGPKDGKGPGNVWGPGNPLGFRNPGGPGNFGIPRTCGSERAQRTMRVWEPLRGLRIPAGPTSPYFLYFFKYNCQPIASSALLHFPGSLFESPWDPLGQSYNCDMAWSQPLTGQSYNRDTARLRPYSTFLSPSGACDLPFAGPHLMCMIWSSRAPLEPARAPGPMTLSPVSPPLQGPACLTPFHPCASIQKKKKDPQITKEKKHEKET